MGKGDLLSKGFTSNIMERPRKKNKKESTSLEANDWLSALLSVLTIGPVFSVDTVNVLSLKLQQAAVLVYS